MTPRKTKSIIVNHFKRKKIIMARFNHNYEGDKAVKDDGVTKVTVVPSDVYNYKQMMVSDLAAIPPAMRQRERAYAEEHYRLVGEVYAKLGEAMQEAFAKWDEEA